MAPPHMDVAPFNSFPFNSAAPANTAVITTTPPPGTLVPSAFVPDGVIDHPGGDAVFQKTTTLHEDVKLILRVESYNVLNHPNLQSPSTSSPASLVLGSPTFGISTGQVPQNDGTTGARQLQGAIKIVF